MNIINSKKKQQNNIELQQKYIPTEQMSISEAIKDIVIKDIEQITEDRLLKLSGLFNEWIPSKYKINDIVNYAGQTYKCFQNHDNAIYPDIYPENVTTLGLKAIPLATLALTACKYLININEQLKLRIENLESKLS